MKVAKGVATTWERSSNITDARQSAGCAAGEVRSYKLQTTFESPPTISSRRPGSAHRMCLRCRAAPGSSFGTPGRGSACARPSSASKEKGLHRSGRAAARARRLDGAPIGPNKQAQLFLAAKGDGDEIRRSLGTVGITSPLFKIRLALKGVLRVDWPDAVGVEGLARAAGAGTIWRYQSSSRA